MFFSKKIRTIFSLSLLLFFSSTYGAWQLNSIPAMMALNLVSALCCADTFTYSHAGEKFSAFPLFSAMFNMLYICGLAINSLDMVKQDFKENVGDIISAAADGDKNRILKAIATGQDINMQSKDGYTPLFWTIRNQHPEALKTLLENGADIELPNQEKMTPLMAACMNNDERIVKQLVWIGVNKKQRNSNSETALDILNKAKQALESRYDIRNKDLLKANEHIHKMLQDSGCVMKYCTPDELKKIDDIKKLWLSKQDESKYNTFYEKGKRCDFFDLNLNYLYKPSIL